MEERSVFQGFFSCKIPCPKGLIVMLTLRGVVIASLALASCRIQAVPPSTNLNQGQVNTSSRFHSAYSSLLTISNKCFLSSSLFLFEHILCYFFCPAYKSCVGGFFEKLLGLPKISRCVTYLLLMKGSGTTVQVFMYGS